MIALSSVSREWMEALGRLGGLVGGKARAAKYTHEQLQQMHASQLNARFARMTPEQACEFQRNAAQGRWKGLTADERSEINRKLIQRRWAKVAYAKNQEKADRLYVFLQKYFSAKRYAPSVGDITRAVHQDKKTVKKLLQILERIGRIQQHAWNRDEGGRGSRWITLRQSGSQSPTVAFSFGEETSSARDSAALVVPRSTTKCYDCDEPAIAGKTRCQQHLARYKGAYAQKKLDGICVNCDEPAVKGSVQCGRHLRLNREACKRFYDARESGRRKQNEEGPLWNRSKAAQGNKRK